LHPKLNLPTAGVITMGAITIIGSLFTLTTVINAAVATLVIIQSLAQVAAIVVLRRRQPDLPRPYKQWLYPLPTIVALVGWVYIYVSASWLSIGLSLGWIAIGAVAYLAYAKAERTWPFGPKEVKEAFVDEVRVT
jgi:amino acid transporter